MTTPRKAILFGAIGTLVETSDMQRQSFNAAFRDAGLDWDWSRVDYQKMLEKPGGQSRIEDYAAARGEEVDAEAVHAAKVAHFRARAELGLELRPGVAEVIAKAKEANVRLGFATSTGSDTVDLIFDGLEKQVSRADFAFIGDRDMVTRSKPSPEIYRIALSSLGLTASDAVAIEDTPESAQAAIDAGVECVGFPGGEIRGRIFPMEVLHVVEHLQPILLGFES